MATIDYHRAYNGGLRVRRVLLRWSWVLERFKPECELAACWSAFDETIWPSIKALGCFPEDAYPATACIVNQYADMNEDGSDPRDLSMVVHSREWPKTLEGAIAPEWRLVPEAGELVEEHVYTLRPEWQHLATDGEWTMANLKRAYESMTGTSYA